MSGDIERMKIIEEKMRERRNWRTSLFTSYQGDYVEISLSEKEYRSYRRTSLILVTAIAGVHLGSGFINNPGMGEFFVVMPYIAALGAIVYYYLFRFQLPRAKNRFRMGEVNLVFRRLKNASILLGVSLIACMAGVISAMRNVPDGTSQPLDSIFLALTGLETVIAVFLIAIQHRILKRIDLV